MNKIFKIKKNHQGQMVVTSELAKNKGKTSEKTLLKTAIATITLGVAASLSLMPSTASAEQVAIEGIATGKDAVSIGENSYSTALDGVSTGQGSVSTGNGFTRDEFKQKVAENQQAVDAVKDKNTEINNNKNQLDATNDAIDALTNQINDLTNQQQHIADKIRQKDGFVNQKNDKTNELGNLEKTLSDAQTKLDQLSKNNKNIYLNFMDVLDTLNWRKIDGSLQKKQELSVDLKNQITTNFPDFIDKFSDQEYLDIIEGYINKQASFQGSVEAFTNRTATDVDAVILGGVNQARNLYNVIAFNNVKANAISDNIEESWILKKKDGELVKEDLVSIEQNYSVRRTEYLDVNNNVKTLDHTRRNVDRIIEHPSNWGGIDTAFNSQEAKQFSKIYERVLGNMDPESLNAIIIANYANIELNKAGEFNPFYHYGQSANWVNGAKIETLYKDRIRDGRVNFDTLNHMMVDKEGTNYNTNIADFAKEYNKTLKQNYAEYTRILVGAKTIDGKTMALNMFDDNIHLLSKFNATRTSSETQISSKDIEQFNTFRKNLTDYVNKIDWNHADAAINLTKYRQDVDKVVAYNDLINNYIELNTWIIKERDKNDPDRVAIETKTVEMLELKKQINNGMNDMSNFFAGIEVEYNQENMKKYMYYPGKDNVDTLIKRINTELKLYDDNARIVTETTTKGTEIQKEYDEAKKAVDDKKKEIADLDKKISDLTLTEDEKATDEKRREKENELKQAEDKKTELEEDLVEKEKELEELKNKLQETSLSNIGIRSQAHGSEAFASGEDSIAMGTKSTVMSKNGIAIGTETKVNGENSIAVGANNTVDGMKSVAIGSNNIISIAAEKSFVLGNDINMNVANSVALGNASTVETPIGTTKIELRGETYNFAGKNPVGTVSVGASDAERTITHVAAGRISDTSTDAINGSQLHAVVDAVENLRASSKVTVSKGDNTHVIKTGDEENGFNFSIHADKTMVTTDDGPLKITTETITNDNGTITTNYKLTLSEEFIKSNAIEESVVAGSNNLTVKQEGLNTTGGKNFVVDLAKDINLSNQGSLTIGEVKLSNTEVNVGGNRIQNLGSPIDDNDATTKQYVDNGRTKVSSKNGSVKIVKTIEQETGAINYDLTVEQKSYKAGSNYLTVTEDTIDLSQNTKNEIDKISKGLNTLTDDSVIKNRQLGDTVAIKGDDKNISTSTENDGTIRVKLKENITAKSVKTGNVSISENGMNAGNKKVTNVANGDIHENSTDAINGGQLHNVLKQINAVQGNHTTNIINQGNQIKHLDNKIDGLKTKVDKNHKRANAGTSSAIATANIPQVINNGKSAASVAIGGYKNENAIAVGYSRASDNGKHVIKMSATTNSQKDFGYGAGYSYQW